MLGRLVIAKLTNGWEYVGILACLDGFMNIVLEHVEEFENGELKNKYGQVFLRGNNVFYISAKTQKKDKEKDKDKQIEIEKDKDVQAITAELPPVTEQK